MKNKKKNSLLLIILLLFVVLTGGYVASTYAKYTSTIDGNSGTATVAKWDFEDDNQATTLTIALDQTVDASTLVANKIAPGTSGSFKVTLKNTDTEVGVNFVVALGAITGKPTNLKFYKDSTYTTELTPGTGTVTGQLAAKDGTGIDVPIYWKWDYETANGDATDTTDGKAAASLTIALTITGTQVNPTAGATTTHIN